jgi:hypothetical protein
MTTRLQGALKREVDIDEATYTLTITAEGLKLVPKGKRNGYELTWRALVSGDAARGRDASRATQGMTAKTARGAVR